MAARIFMRPRAAVKVAALVGGAIIPSAALAEAPANPSSPSKPTLSSRKPIYDDFEISLPKTSVAITPIPSPTSATIPESEKPEPATPSETDSKLAVTVPSQRGPTPTDRLAVQIGKARMFLYHQATAAEDAVNRAADQAFHLEKSFTSTVASLAPSRESGEQLMPGLVYVLVSSMAGSVVTRNRNILLRASAPLALGIGAGWALLPVTMTNVSDLLWTFEKRVPAVADAHLQIRDGVEKGLRFVRVHADLGRNYVDEKVGDARDTLEDWVKKGK